MARPSVELAPEQWGVIGRFLKELRERTNDSQQDVVDRGKPGLSRAPLGLLENGKPENNRPLRSTLLGIQRAYRLPDDWWTLVLNGDLTVSEAIQPNVYLGSQEHLDDDLRAQLIAKADELAAIQAERDRNR